MKYIIALCAMTFVAVTGWRLGGQLSSDAIGMALGILFGIMAAIPASLMMFAAKRHAPYEEDRMDRIHRQQYERQLRHQCPPVIVVTGGGNNAQQPSSDRGEDFGDPWSQRGHPQISGPVDARPERVFRVVGETEEIQDLW